MTCCGLCFCSRGQRTVFFLTLSVPLIALAALFLVILIKALTVEEKFQLEKLSEEEIDLINPDIETQKGKFRKYEKSIVLVAFIQPGPKPSEIL